MFTLWHWTRPPPQMCGKEPSNLGILFAYIIKYTHGIKYTHKDLIRVKKPLFAAYCQCRDPRALCLADVTHVTHCGLPLYEQILDL